MRIAIAGTGRLGRSLIEPLLASHHEIVAVVQNGRKHKGLRRWLYSMASGLEDNITPLSVARQRGIPIVWIDKINEAELAPLRNCHPDLLLVGAFSIILKEPLLSLPKLGCVNCHSALLPKHRGPNPYSAAILASETETGVTFHKMDSGIDTGDILWQTKVSIEPHDTARDLLHKTADAAREQVVALMDAFESGNIAPRPQNDSAATYDRRLPDDQLRIDWTLPAEEIYRSIRAHYSSPLARFQHRRREVRVLHARWSPEPCTAAPGTVMAIHPFVQVATGQGQIVIQQAMGGQYVEWRWPTLTMYPRIGERLE